MADKSERLELAKEAFNELRSEEQFEDLKRRIVKFHLLQLPGQPQAVHMGTSILITQMFEYIKHLRAELEGYMK